MRTYWNTIRHFDRDVRIYLMYNSAMAFAYLGSLNVLLNLYLLRLGYDTTFIGGMLGSGMLLWGILAIPAGAAGARLGLKRSIIISMFILSFSALMLVGAGSLPEPWRARGLVLAWMSLWGGASLVSVNQMPYAMAITNDENRSYVFSIQQTLSALVTLIGSLIAGVLPGLIARPMGLNLDSPVPYQLAMLLSPLFYLIAGLVFLNARDQPVTSHAAAHPTDRAAPLGVLVLLLVVVVLQSASDGAARNFFNIYLDAGLKIPVAQIGAILGLSQVLPVVGALTIPLLMGRMGARGVMLSTNALTVAFILILAAVPNGGAAAMSFMGFAALSSIMGIARSVFSMEVVTPRWRTMSSAVVTVGIALGWAISAWLGGAMISAVGYAGLFYFGAISALLAVVVTLVDGRVVRKTAPQV